MAFVKSGWLLRQSTILRRWKKNWFDLWSDGRLIFYDDQNRRDLEDKIHMRIHCINLRVGNECRDFQPPEGKQRDCLLQIVCRDGKTVNLCAESADDCLAWKIALQDARTNTVYGYDQYHGAYPPVGPQIFYASNGQAYALPYQYPYQGPYGQPTTNHVIIQERYRDSDGDLALGMLAGAATGMALGSLFWVF
ncbi:pleckstrin homology domain-containing family B member 2 isoform X3 [Cinclus cinclus]|uniref:pleckstrin homology domain-containing family B member 2 isoform X3 n=1 Tax=Cinclus cinclus TaxID=127875 RepID=UPI002E0E481B